MSRFVMIMLLACGLTIPALSSLNAQERRPKSDLKQELLNVMEQRLAKQRKQILSDLESIIKEALGVAKQDAGAIGSTEEKIVRLEEQAARMRAMIAELRQRMGDRGQRPAAITLGGVVTDVPVATGFLGVGLGPLEGGARDGLRLGDGVGTQVTQVVPNSPAAKIGLKSGDVITKLDGVDVSFENFTDTIKGKAVGQRIAVSFSRLVDGAPTRFDGSATLADREKLMGAIAPITVAPAPAVVPAIIEAIEVEEAAAPAVPVSLGVRVVQIPDGGVEITEVTDGGNAATAGIQVGDSLVALGNNKVANIDDVRQALAGIKVGAEEAIAYRRGEKLMISMLRWGGGDVAPRLSSKSTSGDAKPDTDARRSGHLGIEVEETDGGVRIIEVGAGTSADLMGLKVGDLIVAVNDVKAASTDALGPVFAKLYVGDKVTVAIVRQGVNYKISGKLGE